MYGILLYILIPLIPLIVGLFMGWIDRMRVLAMMLFFAGVVVGVVTGNLLAVEFFWVFSLIFFKEWKLQSQGEGIF